MTSDASKKSFSYGQTELSADSSRLISLWMEFGRLFPTEESCLETILVLRYPDRNFNCGFCLAKLEFRAVQRMIYCDGCRKRNWVTACTFFRRARKLRPWVAALWFLENGVVMPSARFARLLSISQSSASNILRKIGMVLEFQQLLKEHSTLPSENFSDIVIRRSRETPNGVHPREEFLYETGSEYSAEGKSEQLDSPASQVITNNESVESCAASGGDSSNVDDMTDSKAHNEAQGNPEEDRNVIETPAFKEHDLPLTSLEQDILKHFRLEPVYVEELCQCLESSPAQIFSTLTILELNGLIQRCPGGSYVRVQKRSLGRNLDGAGTSLIFQAALSFIKSIFQGVSRKYLQLYLSLFCEIDAVQRVGRREIIKSLFQSEAVKYSAILNYVSPQNVHLTCDNA